MLIIKSRVSHEYIKNQITPHTYIYIHVHEYINNWDPLKIQRDKLYIIDHCMGNSTSILIIYYTMKH